MGTYNPPHPAAILHEDVLPELRMTTTDLAKALGYFKVRLSKVLNGHASITPDSRPPRARRYTLLAVVPRGSPHHGKYRAVGRTTGA